MIGILYFSKFPDILVLRVFADTILIEPKTKAIRQKLRFKTNFSENVDLYFQLAASRCFTCVNCDPLRIPGEKIIYDTFQYLMYPKSKFYLNWFNSFRVYSLLTNQDLYVTPRFNRL